MSNRILATAIFLGTLGCGREPSISESQPSPLLAALADPALVIGSNPISSSNDGASARAAGPRAKFVVDPADQSEFAYGVAAPVATGAVAQEQTVGGSPFEAHLAMQDARMSVKRRGAPVGVTFTPVEGGLAFSPGVEKSGSVMYASADGKAAMVLTPNDAGVKEDIVLSQSLGDEALFQWDLALPAGLEARVDANGDVGIYGPSSILADDIQIGDEKSGAMLQAARENARKDQLIYRIPAPIVRDTSGQSRHDLAALELNGSRLSLRAHGLAALQYPINIDPTVVVTLTADFSLGGSLETDIDATGDQLKRTKGVTDIGTFAATSSFATARQYPTGVAYNGHLYIVGGTNGTTTFSDVQVATINADGTVGTWAATTSLPSARSQHATVAYDGHLYVTGGLASDGTFKSDVFVATINSDGTLGAWSANTSLPAAAAAHSSVAYNGYLYVLGGAADNTGPANQLFIASINGDGTITAWTSHTLGRIVYHHASVAYNGHMYLIGGEGSNGLAFTTVSYQTINSDGTLVSGWNTANVLPAGRSDVTAVAYGGSLYVTNGYSTDSSAAVTEVDYATIRADGSVGTWNQTARSSANGTLSARSGQGGAAYNGKIYIFGGASGSIYLNDVQVAPLVNGGTLGPSWTSTTAFTTARVQSASVAYNGELYVIGGVSSAGTRLADVQFTGISDGGTLQNSWTTTTAFPTARSGHTAIAYNGFLYVIGGQSASAVLNDVQFAPINADGTIGTWTGTSSFTTARRAHTSVVYDGNLYVIGGLNSAGARLSDVQVASINSSNGTLGTWQTTTALPAGLSESAGVAYSGCLYMIGGIDNTGSPTGNLMAPINTDGTVGAWTATTSPATPTYEHTAVAVNGYVYVLGGTNSSGSASAFVGYAPINANGTLGTWTATTSLTPARFEHAGVA